MKKRAQVTIFVIIIIVIISSILLIFLLPEKNKSSLKKSQSNLEEINKQSREVQGFIKSFIENKGLLCLKKIGENGGYNEVPQEISVQETSYWYYEGISLQPFLPKIEEEIKKCLDNELKNHPPNLIKNFPNIRIKLEKDKANSKIIIKDNSVKIEVKYPYKISDENSSSNTENFEIIYPLNLKKLYEISTSIVNQAATPEFYICDVSKCGSDGLEFSFLTNNEDIIIKGAASLQVGNIGSPYQLKFAIRRPISESFGDGGKKIAILYQENVDLPTFGNKAASILKDNLNIVQGADYFSCEEIPSFFNNINNYNVIIITGNLQYQIVSLDNLNLLYGCNSFNSPSRKIALKNWINNGGILWVNYISKYETDDFISSYIGSLGYTGGAWKDLNGNDLPSYQDEIISSLEEKREIINTNEILSSEIISCPNNLTSDIIGIWSQNGLSITDEDKIILGSKENAKLWIRKLGKGVIVFDEFPLKDNLWNRFSYQDDLASKNIAEKYFYNVLTYLAKFSLNMEENKITIIEPSNDAILVEPIIKFSSSLPENTNFNIIIVDFKGQKTIINLDNIAPQKNTLDQNTEYTYNLQGNLNLNEMLVGRYEYQIKSGEYLSNIESFIIGGQI